VRAFTTLSRASRAGDGAERAGGHFAPHYTNFQVHTFFRGID